jgi:hypothetical protein
VNGGGDEEGFAIQRFAALFAKRRQALRMLRRDVFAAEHRSMNIAGRIGTTRQSDRGAS